MLFIMFNVRIVILCQKSHFLFPKDSVPKETVTFISNLKL